MKITHNDLLMMEIRLDAVTADQPKNVVYHDFRRLINEHRQRMFDDTFPRYVIVVSKDDGSSSALGPFAMERDATREMKELEDRDPETREIGEFGIPKTIYAVHKLFRIGSQSHDITLQ